MDNALQTVQLISIYSYLNHLSDFLFNKQYIKEDDQHKPIPIVNALYKYFEDNRKNQNKKQELIRALLRGSDLYGEEENENFDYAFVNAMFDYIISSLVFEKYGNIYGFLATVAYKVTNQRLESFYSEIKNTLLTDTFENEYGNHSALTPLAGSRIFTNLIFPLFLQSDTNLNLSSIEFIYAHACLHFSRSGRINSNYFKNPSLDYDMDNDTIFNECIFTGHTIEHLIFTNRLSNLSLNSFALPAFCNYIFDNKNLFNNDNVKNVVYNVSHWQAAYTHLFKITLDELQKQLNTDYSYQLHTEFLKFTNLNILARFHIDRVCSHFDPTERERRLHQYLDYPENYECIFDGNHYLPNLTKYYTDSVKKVSDKYYSFALELNKETFISTLRNLLRYVDVHVTLLVPDDNVNAGVLKKTKHLPYDLLKFYFPKNETVENYALIQENYSATLIKESDNPQRFQQIIGSSFSELETGRLSLVLKESVNKLNVLWRNFAEYKRTRFESYLKFLSVEQLQSEWWKEFGLSFVPYYPCLSASYSVMLYNEFKACAIDDNMFLSLSNKGEDAFLKLTQKRTRSVLRSKGISYTMIYWKKFVNQVGEFEGMNSVFQKLLLHLDEPAFELTFLSNQEVANLRFAISNLVETPNISFVNVIRRLNNMKRSQINSKRRIDNTDTTVATQLYVMSELKNYLTGYGYKFVFLPSNKIAELRTDHHLNKKILVSLASDSPENGLVYVKVNKRSLQLEDDQMYYVNVNNQLQQVATSFWFSGISIPRYYRRECDVDEGITKTTLSNKCPRALLWKERVKNEDAAVKLATWKFHLFEIEVRHEIRNCVFPDEGRNYLQFIEEWENTKHLPKDYEFANRDLFLKLKYEMLFEDTTTLKKDDMEFRINFSYTLKERYQVEKGTSLFNIMKAYKKNKEYYSVTFEDYYALCNFANTGYTRITGDTNEAKRMKLALYKLAIRQSDGPTKEFLDFYDAKLNYTRADDVKKLNVIKTNIINLKSDSQNFDIASHTLYKVDCKVKKFVDKFLVPGKKFKFQRFTSASTNEQFAMELAAKASFGLQNILYEMEFLNSPISAKFILSSSNEKLLVILPGTEFIVNRTEILYTERFGEVLSVRLTYKHTPVEKYNCLKKVMSEITKMV